MATYNDSTFREGQSTIRPPFFDGNDYPYWKTRMRIYLQALDYEIWEIVCDGPFMPLTKNGVGEDIPKPSREWNELEKRKASLNSKAMNALFCALDKKEFHRVSSCESANEIWHKLEVVYEGTNQVKESKISRYTRQYELFQMEQNESVYSMYTRFTDIVNTLGALGKTFSNSEKVKKIIRSLPKEWRPKRTAIEEAKDLNILPIDDLIGSLISYEEDMAAERSNEEKKKSIALKASKYESDEESELDEEEMDMLARRLRKLFKKSGERRKSRDLKNRKEKKEVIKCYECKKPGHIRTECPLLNKLKKKAMVATWDDSDEETSDGEEHQEMTNLALMATGDESDDELDEGLRPLSAKLTLVDVEPVRPITSKLFEPFSKPAQSTPTPQQAASLDDELVFPPEFPSQVNQAKPSQITRRKSNKGKGRSSKGSFSVSQDLKMVSGRAASKGPFEGVLLSAVALVNQLIFLLAVCVCESENTDNWTWFLGYLKEFLADARQLTFMTDKHKGILNAINLEFYGSQNSQLEAFKALGGLDSEILELGWLGGLNTHRKRLTVASSSGASFQRMNTSASQTIATTPYTSKEF
ncbi:hypothetical protein KPL70_017569 [Citrus sinensis]|nr:hypothetical protein KPL70_017569 [Citrus sinensis]